MWLVQYKSDIGDYIEGLFTTKEKAMKYLGITNLIEDNWWVGREGIIESYKIPSKNNCYLLRIEVID